MSSGPKETTTTTDPWSKMPPWLKEAYQTDINERNRLLGDAEELGPRELLEMNEEERSAYEDLQRKTEANDTFGQEAKDIASGLKGGDIGGNYDDLLKEYELNNATDGLGGFDHGYDPNASNYTGDRLNDLIGDKDFELDYTNDVVDSTLAGMDRQTERERLARQSRQAATGGTSNTRSAVEDAVSGQLSGMNRAQMEAELRDSAQRYGGEMLMDKAGLLDDSDRFSAEFGDQKNQFLSGQNLQQQEMEELSKRFGMEFDKGLADSRQGAFENGMNFDFERAGLIDELTNSGQKRDLANYSIRNAFGEKQRGIDQTNADKERTQLEWLMGLRNGSSGAVTGAPTGNTQTTTQPGNSALQNVLGIGSSLAGAWMMMSDENVKEDIEPLDGHDALDAVMEMTPAEYKYRDGFGHRTDRHAGLIAQSAAKAKGATALSDDGVMLLDPMPVLATVVSAVQELKRESDNQRPQGEN